MPAFAIGFPLVEPRRVMEAGSPLMYSLSSIRYLSRVVGARSSRSQYFAPYSAMVGICSAIRRACLSCSRSA
jgi:hypothetical protein